MILLEIHPFYNFSLNHDYGRKGNLKNMTQMLPSLKLTACPWKCPSFLVNTIKKMVGFFQPAMLVYRSQECRVFSFHPVRSFCHQALAHLTMAEICRLTTQLTKGQTAAEQALSGSPSNHRCVGIMLIVREQWKKPGCLVYIGGYTTQLYRDYNKPL